MGLKFFLKKVLLTDTDFNKRLINLEDFIYFYFFFKKMVDLLTVVRK